MARPRPDQALRAWAAAVERPMLAWQSKAGPPPGWAFFCGVQMMAGQVAIMPDDALARVKSAFSEELRRRRHVEPEQVHGPSKNVGSLSDRRRARS